MRFRAVIFDLDETLMPEHAAVEAAFREACLPAAEKHGVDAQELSEAFRRYGRELWYASPCHPWCQQIGISSWEGLSGDFGGDGEGLSALRGWIETSRFRAVAWRRGLAELGVGDDDLAEQLAEALPGVRRRHHSAYPQSTGVLDSLRGRCRLGLLTNGVPRIQRGKLAGAGLTEYFDEIVISGEVGFGKPDRRVFEHALERLGVSAGEAVMIGDSLRSDIGGANAAGIFSIWVNRSGKPREDDTVPDAEVADLTAVCELLA